jgi:hypothetical protein
MRKGVLKFSILVAAVVITSFGFSSKKTIFKIPQNYLIEEQLIYTVQNIEQKEPAITPPFLGKTFVGFKEALAFKESRGDYSSINFLGYMGKYQFGASTLQLLGVYNSHVFLNNPALQEKAFIANTARNKWILRKDIKRFSGKYLNGFKVTESGILAAAHLAGAGNVKKYLRSYGKVDFEDANGVSIRNYMKRFSGYDTSNIIPKRRAKI